MVAVFEDLRVVNDTGYYLQGNNPKFSNYNDRIWPWVSSVICEKKTIKMNLYALPPLPEG
jgi:hypothetical protein